jgi:phosphate-selective porin OprO and OprP
MHRQTDRAGIMLSGSKWKVIGGVFIVLAQQAAIERAAAQDSGPDFERLWSKVQLFTGDSDAAVQSVALTGRFQVDYANVGSDDADYSDLGIRRFRFGVKMGFFDNFTFHAEGEYDPNAGDFDYKRLTDAYLAWSRSDLFELTVGKHSAPFTMDGQTSSKELLTVDRSNLTNNIWFTEEYMPGISASGEKGNLVYHLGWYSSGSRAGFGKFDGGQFVLATIGYDFAEKFGAEEALLRVNVVDNEPDPKNDFTRPLEHITSVNFSFDAGRWGVQSDVSAATGYYGQSDLWGVMVMPYFDLMPTVQLVTRYTYLKSDDPNGIRFARYENQVVSGRGDEYNEIYLGFNYYWYGHKLKLQTALQYVDMKDSAADVGTYRGWSFTTGLRVSW